MAQTALPSSTSRIAAPYLNAYLDWNGDHDYSDTSENVSAYVLEASGTSEAVARADSSGGNLGQSVADTARLTLANPAGIFSRNKAGAVAAPYGARLNDAKIEIGFVGDGHLTVFTGVVWDMAESVREPAVTVELLDRWALLRAKTASTPLYTHKRTDELIALALSASGYGWAATLEKCDRVFSYWWLERESIADELIRLAEASGGLVWIDNLGALRYWSATWPARNTSVIAPTITDDYPDDLTPDLDFANVKDLVTVRARQRFPALLADVWTSEDDLAVEAGSTRDLKVQFREPVYALAAPAYVASSVDGWQDATDWIAVTAAHQIMETAGAPDVTVELLNVAGDPIFDAGGAVIDSFEAQSCTIRLTNGNTTHRAYLRKLRIRGNPLVAGRDYLAESSSGGTVRETLEIDNPLVQSPAHADAVAAMRRYALRNPREVLTVKGVRGQPHWQIYDRVHVTNAASGLDDDFFLVRIDWRFTPSDGYTMDLGLVLAADYTPRSDYFQIGVSALGARRLWF